MRHDAAAIGGSGTEPLGPLSVRENIMNLLEVKNLKVYFKVKYWFLSRVKAHVKAVDDGSLTIQQGETLGLVGGSGCGKTTLGRAIVKLVEPTAGSVSLEGWDITQMEGTALRAQ